MRKKRISILLTVLWLSAACSVHAEEQLIQVEENILNGEQLIQTEESVLQGDQVIQEEESGTETIRLTDSYQVLFRTITGGGFVSVEFPELVQTGSENIYEYAGEINQKFLEEAEASAETEQAAMEEIYQGLLENSNLESAEYLYYETTCDSVYLLGSAYSVMQSHYTYTGGAHPYSWVTGVTYDLSTGKEMTMGEILGCDEATAQEAVVLAYWDNIIGQVEYITEESIRESFDAMEYWFDEDGMRVSLAPYIVASYAAGPQDVLVTQEHVAQAKNQSAEIMIY